MNAKLEKTTEIIKQFYDQGAEYEWTRFERQPIEFLITKHVLDQYIQPGESVLDLGGGPGRYALYYAQKSCQVTLVDLADGNIDLAKIKADEAGLTIEAKAGNALDADTLLAGRQFDNVLLMGPLYHLLEEEDRARAVRNALKLLKPGGRIYVSFLLMFSGMIYYMKYIPNGIQDPSDEPFFNAVINDGSYSGSAFTQAYFIRQGDVLPFMAQFNLEDQHIFGQEGILAQFQPVWMQQSEEVKQGWLNMAYKLCERPEYLSYSEHVMVHGRKPVEE
ncbi:MAG: class I SAM-dependent methyltransferase [Anaerolineaceae bacterium]